MILTAWTALGIPLILMLALYLIGCVLIFTHTRSLFPRSHLESNSPPRDALSPDALPPRHRRIGLVIAHPDDESMFFVPTLTHLQRQHPQHIVSILCLSTGNADGLGETRKLELIAAAALLGVPASRVQIVDDAVNLADGLHSRWSVVEARGHIDRFVSDQRLDLLLTFDAQGISGHPNHVACFDAVQSLLRLRHTAAAIPSSNPSDPSPDSPLCGYALQSTPLWRKYLGPLDALCSALEEHSASRLEWSPDGMSQFYLLVDPSSLSAMRRSYAAMQAHSSQFVWFRRLFVIFSRYTFINTLVRIEATSGAASARVR